MDYLGGGGGWAKGMLPHPPSHIIGGGLGPPPAPPLSTPMKCYYDKEHTILFATHFHLVPFTVYCILQN